MNEVGIVSRSRRKDVFEMRGVRQVWVLHAVFPKMQKMSRGFTMIGYCYIGKTVVLLWQATFAGSRRAYKALLCSRMRGTSFGSAMDMGSIR